MAAPTNHYKLGLFVVVGGAAAVFTGAMLGGSVMHKDTILYHSFFNESVQGLDLGSPVKFRGVTIGHVSAIEIAPDHRMVDVASELDTKDVLRMGLNEAGRGHGKERFAIPIDLRVQLNSQGVTGVKFVAIDFFDIKSNPAPELPFATPPNHYIPAAPSMMKNLENTVAKAMERLPEMVDAVVKIMQHIDGLFVTLEQQDVPGKAIATLGHADAVMTTLQTTLGRIDKQDLGAKAANTFNNLDLAVTKLNLVLEELGGQKGLLASAQHATDAFGEVGRAGRGTQKDLEATLRDVGEAAQSIRALVDSLDRDPDMLLKGKSKRKAAQ